MNETILVVDDEPKIVKQARDYLERSNFRVVTASDGQNALTLARHERPDLVVLDEPMSGLDPLGRALVRDLITEEARQGRTVFYSSHILHEVDLISDQVVLLNEGYVVAEGNIRGVRSEMQKHPLQVTIRCIPLDAPDDPGRVLLATLAIPPVQSQILADQPPQHRLHRAEHLAGIQHRRLEHLLAAERQELPGELRRPLGSPGDLLEHLEA